MVIITKGMGAVLKKYGKSENTFYKNEISNYEATFTDFLIQLPDAGGV